MPDYSGSWFTPPAPLASVTARNIETGQTVSDVLMLLDSGADVSLVPLNVVRNLGLLSASAPQVELAGFDGTVTLASAVRLELGFCGRNFRGEFLVIEQEWGILGRNVLNSLPLLLDGPTLKWDVHA